MIRVDADAAGGAYAFRPEGFQRGDTVRVVLPDVWCGDLVIGAFGASVAMTSPQPVRLDVR